MKKIILLSFLCSPLFFLFVSCNRKQVEIPINMSSIAEQYVKLVLQLGKIDKGYVDSYFGTERLKSYAESENLGLDQILFRADSLLNKLNTYKENYFSPIWKLRYNFLKKQISSMKFRIKFLKGEKRPFNSESKGLYDISASFVADSQANEILEEIEKLLPGEGDLNTRYNNFIENFLIPKGKVPIVIMTCLNESRKRTKEFINLPKNENVSIEFVTEKPWRAYNWYKGYFQSMVQINLDLPVYLHQVVDFVCHEAYPGHHVFMSMQELKLYRDSGWVENSVYPLFSPMSVMAEAYADYGIDICFPMEDRIRFEEDSLCKIAEINPEKVELLYKIQKKLKRMKEFQIEIARRYIDETVNKEQAIQLLMKYMLQSREQAEKYLLFADSYRSYTATYFVGYKLIKNYFIDRLAKDQKKKWELFYDLISKPYLPNNF